jgi:hypothetical protein
MSWGFTGGALLPRPGGGFVIWLAFFFCINPALVGGLLFFELCLVLLWEDNGIGSGGGGIRDAEG